ncbi:MAG TPA: hypothetical protein VFI91_03440 [Longimicrobiaceae bacterium]|nr:hypothetical protein [Longimicrobiaceae bacterium]
MRALRSITAALALCIAGCGQEAATSVEIAYHELEPIEARERSIAALESGFNVICVKRVIRAPDSCRDLAAELARAGSHLTLRVTARQTAENCTPGEAVYAYTARLGGLRPGRYELQVVHSVEGSASSPSIVMEHPIVVLDRP